MFHVAAVKNITSSLTTCPALASEPYATHLPISRRWVGDIDISGTIPIQMAKLTALQELCVFARVCVNMRKHISLHLTTPSHVPLRFIALHSTRLMAGNASLALA